MFVGNFTSVADERAKKKNQKDVLKLMIQNESMKERKVKDYQNPFNPPEVPPQYKHEQNEEETPQNKNKKRSPICKVCLTLTCEV